MYRHTFIPYHLIIWCNCPIVKTKQNYMKTLIPVHNVKSDESGVIYWSGRPLYGE